MIPVLVALVALLAMEPLVTVVHRRVMHGWGWAWHRSHHRAATRAVEANDLFPVVFAAATVAMMAVGAAAFAPLLWIGWGVTAYGAAYLVVHDLYIHQRLGTLPGATSRYVSWVAEAHRIHHLFGQAPHGFLLPVVSRDLRARAQERPGRDVLTRRGGVTVGARSL